MPEPTFNRTPLRHRLLHATAAGGLPAIKRILFLDGNKQRQIYALRDAGMLEESDLEQLTEKGKQTLIQWNVVYGKPMGRAFLKIAQSLEEK